MLSSSSMLNRIASFLSIVLDILALKTPCGVRIFSFIPRAVNKLAHNIATAHSL